MKKGIIALIVVLTAVLVGVLVFSKAKKQPTQQPTSQDNSTQTSAPKNSQPHSPQPSVPSPIPQSQPSNLPKDYGANLDGFITAAQTCTPSRVLATLKTQSGFGPAYIFNEDASIKGYSGQYCRLFSTRIDADLVVDQNFLKQAVAAGAITQAQADQIAISPSDASDTKKNNVGLTQDCTFTIPNLIKFLNNWKNPDTSTIGTDPTGLLKYCKVIPPTSK